MISNNQDPLTDVYRLQFHLTPSQGLLNDPNGFIEYDGIYHLFYQWNPFTPTHEMKHWGIIHLKIWLTGSGSSRHSARTAGMIKMVVIQEVP